MDLRIIMGRITESRAMPHMARQRGDAQRPLASPWDMISACRKDLSMTGPRTSPTTRGGRFIVEFAHDIAQDACAQHHPDVEKGAVVPVGADRAQNQDDRHQIVVGNPDDLGKYPHQGRFRISSIILPR